MFKSNLKSQRRNDLSVVRLCGLLQHNENIYIGGFRRFTSRSAPIENNLMDCLTESVRKPPSEFFE